MSLYNWCKIAQNEFEQHFPENHNYINWLNTISQKLVDSTNLTNFEIAVSKLHKDKPIINSSKLLYRAVTNIIKDSGIKIRTSGPKIKLPNTLILANITRTKYLISNRANDDTPSIRNKINKKPKGGFRPGGNNSTRIVWLTPAEKLLKKMTLVPENLKISFGCQLLGLDNANQECKIIFYKVKVNGSIYRPNIFTLGDSIRWACTPFDGHPEFGTALNGLSGKASLPEAITTEDNLDEIKPEFINDWLNEDWFTS
ncbi:MAG: hypothetical protein HRU28_10020, partial [Rhizobiales bacterium]|nr:hypothetical protein [Hyphomicrobiales bacterium]